MKRSEQLNELAPALVKAQAAIKNAELDAKGMIGKRTYKYSSLASVKKAIGQALADNGLALLQFPLSDEHGNLGVESILLHTSGQFVSETDLFPNGDVLAQVGPNIARRNRSGDLVDYFDEFYVHHDVDVLPWGNLLAITSIELQKKVDAADHFSRDWVIEIDMQTRLLPTILHLEFLIPEMEFCNACIVQNVTGGRDWIHANSVDYDLADEAIYVSVRNLNRIYKIRWPEGHVEWIMGDGGDFGHGLFVHQHNPVRLSPDRMLVFDNDLHGDPFTRARSRVVEIEYDPSIPDARIVWEYAGPPAFYSEAQGDASRLPNGNTLVVDGFNGRIVEVTPDGQPVWELEMPGHYYIYKAHRIENFP